jgi:hypothetical protein
MSIAAAPLQQAADFSNDASAWQPIASGQAQVTLSSVPAGRVRGLQIKYDFKGGGGFVVARRDLMRAMPEDYVLSFRLRGRGAVNNLELKLVDVSGQNVWRHVKKNLSLPARWTNVKVDSREMEFAWGPTSGGVITELGAIEIAVVAGEGGAGTVWISGLTIKDAGPTQAAMLSASSALPEFGAAQALAGSGWKPDPHDAEPWIVVDFVEPRRLGALAIDWLAGAPPSGFRVRGSMSGRRWSTLHRAKRAGGERSYVYLPNTQVRYLRLELRAPSGGAVLRPQSFEFSRSIDSFWHNIARSEPRGWHPRWLHREQSLWTPIGTSNGRHCALINEEGLVEIEPGSCSIEPALLIKDRLFTWADVGPTQELLQGFLPVPSVIWDTAEWRLCVQAEATVTGVLRVRYRLENLSDKVLSARVFVLVRPFQVTPPWQNFGAIGGVSRIHDLVWQKGAVRVNDTLLIVPTTKPHAFAATAFDEGFIVPQLAAGKLPTHSKTHDKFGFASGALAFELSLKPRASDERIVECLREATTRVIGEPAFDWSAKLPEKQWSGNDWATDAIRAALTATAHVLVTRSAAALQPGPRRYTRSWIRDGTIMSAALLRMGCVEEIREFIRWYMPYQRADGFVPCCVDVNGPDWLIEHDSHGELIALVADYYRFTADERLLKESWPSIEKAVGCIAGLLEPDGLLPISVSHEGYLAQPVHSYWDDFWALRGLRDATQLARVVGDGKLAEAWQGLATRFASTLYESIERTRRERSLDFIPGSIEWADFDPTSTANAIALLDVADGLDRAALERTFDRYLYDWRRKRTGALQWSNYTPYEIRIIGAFVRLGRRDAALELLRFFLAERCPPAWNQWPEIAWRDPRAPAHIGDLPHTWVAAEYVLAVRSLFAYEREADQALVLGAGLAGEWIAARGVQVIRMPTLYGSLSYSLRSRNANTLECKIESGVGAKIILRPPLTAALHSVAVNGRACTSFEKDSVTISESPAEVICTICDTR